MELRYDARSRGPRPTPPRKLLIHTYILLALLAWLLAQSATSVFFPHHPADAMFGLFCTPTFALLGLAQVIATFARRPGAALTAAVMSFAIGLPFFLVFAMTIANRPSDGFTSWLRDLLIFGGVAAYAAFIAVLNLRWAADLRRPTPPGICRHCGYDLRATPLRCPECGTPNARENP